MWPMNPEYRTIAVMEYPIMREGGVGLKGKKREKIRKLFGV
jgi:hypothetical protein